MERGQSSDIVVHWGGTAGRWTVLWLVLSALVILSCSFALVWVHSHNVLFLSVGLSAILVTRRTYQALCRETLTLSDHSMRLTFDGPFGQEQRTFELAEVSTLEIVRRRTRRGAAGESITRYFRFWYQGRPEQARRELSAQDAWQLERVFEQLEERECDAEGPPREDPLVYRGGPYPEVLRRLRR